MQKILWKVQKIVCDSEWSHMRNGLHSAPCIQVPLEVRGGNCTKDTNGKIRTSFSIEYCGMILVLTLKPGAHSTFVETLTAFHLCLHYWNQVWNQSNFHRCLWIRSFFSYLSISIVKLHYISLTFGKVLENEKEVNIFYWNEIAQLIILASKIFIWFLFHSTPFKIWGVSFIPLDVLI